MTCRGYKSVGSCAVTSIRDHLQSARRKRVVDELDGVYRDRFLVAFRLRDFGIDTANRLGNSSKRDIDALI